MPQECEGNDTAIHDRERLAWRIIVAMYSRRYSDRLRQVLRSPFSDKKGFYCSKSLDSVGNDSTLFYKIILQNIFCSLQRAVE